MALYDAFISYSHAKDKPAAAALQSIVQRLGKPWYRRALCEKLAAVDPGNATRHVAHPDMRRADRVRPARLRSFSAHAA
jgi:hypothetical protein